MTTTDKSPSREQSAPRRLSGDRILGSAWDDGELSLRTLALVVRGYFPDTVFGAVRNQAGRELCDTILEASYALQRARSERDAAEHALRDAGWHQDATGEWCPPPRLPGFAMGDSVSKITGDYTFDGQVRGVVLKKRGQVRYVVEDDRGLLHIFSAAQLAPRDATRRA